MNDAQQTGTKPATTDPEFQVTTGSKPQDTSAIEPGQKKVFSRNDTVRIVTVGVHWPEIYPNYEPWVFKLRLKLSADAEERRQEYMALTPTDMTVREPEQNLDELCDLLTELPTGFSDIVPDGTGPGPSFKNYVLTAGPTTKELLLNIVRGAITLYWRKISPQEFRPKV